MQNHGNEVISANIKLWKLLRFFVKSISGCIHLLNTCKYCDNTRRAFWWYLQVLCQYLKMWSPASIIFASIVTILVSFEAFLKRILVIIKFGSSFQRNDRILSFKIGQNWLKTYKYHFKTCNYYTCRLSYFSSIGLLLVSTINHNTMRVSLQYL